MAQTGRTSLSVRRASGERAHALTGLVAEASFLGGLKASVTTEQRGRAVGERGGQE